MTAVEDLRRAERRGIVGLTTMLVFDLSSTFSRIRLRGATRVDFLQRMSTGDLLKMLPGEGRATVLTTPIGRMIDYLLVLAHEDSLLMVGQGGARDKTLRWLRKHIFFNDDVHVSDETETTQMSFGDQSIIEGFTGDASALSLVPLAQLAPLAHRPVADALVVRAPAALGDGFFTIGPHLESRGDSIDWEGYRVVQGYPAFPNEISEEYIPLEAGLWGAVSFNKGCYTGQEIIARMESRGQIAKRLCRLTSSVDRLEVGADLFSQAGESVGKITSATRGAALGYVRSAFATEGETLRTAPNDVAHVVKTVRI